MTVNRLQTWYADRLDGEWEKRYGVYLWCDTKSVWSMHVDLPPEASKRFEETIEPIAGDDTQPEWIKTVFAGNQFAGSCSPLQLTTLVEEFLSTWEKAGLAPIDCVGQGQNAIESLQQWSAGLYVGDGRQVDEFQLMNIAEGGWWIRVNLASEIAKRVRGVCKPMKDNPDDQTWLRTFIHSDAFIGSCSPLQLSELIAEFLDTWDRALLNNVG